MRKEAKRTSLNQAVWRAKKRKKNNIKPKWRWFENEEIEDILTLRRNFSTYKAIAEKYNCSIRAIEKQCKKANIKLPPKRIKTRTYVELGMMSPKEYYYNHYKSKGRHNQNERFKEKKKANNL